MSVETSPEDHRYDSNEDPSPSVVVNVEPPSTAATTAANGINNTDNNGSDSSLAKGLSSIISSVIRDFDFKAEDTVRSQDKLSFAIDRLSRELDQLLEDAPMPFIMQHAAKISGVRKRVSSLNLVLKSIQRRVDNIDRMLSAGLVHEKKTSGSAGQH